MLMLLMALKIPDLIPEPEFLWEIGKNTAVWGPGALFYCLHFHRGRLRAGPLLNGQDSWVMLELYPVLLLSKSMELRHLHRCIGNPAEWMGFQDHARRWTQTRGFLSVSKKMKHLNTYLLIPNNTVGNTSVEGEVSSEKATKDRFWMIDSCAIIIMTSFQPPFFTYLLLCMKNFFFFFW